MVFVIQAEEALLFLFNLGKEAIPWDYIVLVFVIEDHLSVDEIFNNLLTAAVQQEIGPGRLYSYALLVMVNKRILMEVKRRSLIDVEWGCTEENYEYQDGVDPSRHNWAFTKTEMPNVIAEVIRHAEASLLSHSLQASTAAMHSVFSQKEDYG